MKDLFIGLDVHKKSWAITIRNEHGVLKRFSMKSDASSFISYIQLHYPGYNVTCCYESCCCGYHIYRSLTEAGFTVLVVNPGDLPRINKQSSSKTDKIDSAYLSAHLSAGRLHGIYVPDEKQEQLRSLFRRRNDLVKNLRRIKCHIKSMLLYYGIDLPAQFDNNSWSKAMQQWVTQIKWLYATAASAMESRMKEYDFLHHQYLHVSKELRSYVQLHYKIPYYLYRSVPGVGPLTAIATLSEVGDIKRFKGIDRLSSYVGLVPSIYSSGEKSYSRGITYRSKSLLRSYLIEGAWMAAKKDEELRQYYLERKGCDHRKIIVKMAAKTLARMYHVIKTGEPYVPLAARKQVNN
jgi:transposase